MIQQQHIAQLLAFHAAHFPGQPTPKSITTQQPAVAEIESAPATIDDDLGCYEDGVKRTLTDTQIKLFRHSEIQRLLSERRAAREKETTRNIDKGNGSGPPGTREARKRRFYDVPSTDRPDVDILMYDDPQENQSTSSPAEKKFLWPILGEQPT